MYTTMYMYNTMYMYITKEKQLKTIDPNRLFERSFRSDAEFGGDKQPTKDAANAKRVATALKTAASNYRFENLLEPEQLLALRAATNVMSNLACVLDEVCILSKRHFKKCEADRQVKAAQVKAARESELDVAAAARWGDDAQMLVEAEDLATFFKDGEGWLERRRGGNCHYLIKPYIDVGCGCGPPDSSSSYRLQNLFDACKKEPTMAALCALRRYVAATVDALVTETRASYFYNGHDWHYPRLSDFEAWRAERDDLRRSVVLAVGGSTA